MERAILTPEPTPPDARTAELRELAGVLRRAIGILTAYWAAIGLPPEHPYRQAAQTVAGYLARRYGG